MQESPVFEIRDLVCSYKIGVPIVRVDELKLHPHQIVFIVGPSGIGKSTLLETLGLMNYTIENPDTASVQFFDYAGTKVDLINAWKSSDSELSKFRARYFSFIFQETNLMPGLSAGENLCMKLLIQGYTLAESRSKAEEYMKAVGLNSLIFDRPIYQLSGGQRQRLAFLRAFLGTSDVLLCDEPTGNLDRPTAVNLMGILRASIVSGARKLAIIVSHDLELAFNFGDMIIPVRPNIESSDTERIVGKVHYGDILMKKDGDWINYEGTKMKSYSEVANVISYP